MKKLIAIGFLACMVACSSTRVSYDYDKSTDFSKYQTYNYSEDAMNLPIQQLNRDRVLNAIDKEMTARGFTKSEDPDVLVDLHAKTEEKRDATATTTSDGMYGNPWAWGYAPGFSTTQINVNEYTEGTLFINIVDAGMEKIVWQGIGRGALNEGNISPEKREENINKAISKIFENYPVAAAPNS